MSEVVEEDEHSADSVFFK
jgi:hypothetical protein